MVFRLLEHAQEPSENQKGKRKWEEWKKRQGFGPETPSQSHDPQQSKEISLPSDVVGMRRIPIWFRERRGRQYLESDPEFQEFVRFQSDKKRTSSAIQHVTKSAHTSIKQRYMSHHKNILAYIGFQGNVYPQLMDVAIIPQIIPPPSYEVPTLFIYRDGISVGWTALPPDMGRKWNVIFHPLVTLAAAKASAQVFFHLSYHIIYSKISGSPNLHIPTLPGILSAKPSSNNDREVSGQNLDSASAKVKDLIKAFHEGQSSAKRHSDMLAHLPLSHPIKVAAVVFRRKQLDGLARTQVDQARGTVRITGKLVYEGRFGRYIVNVTATYLPAEDRFLSVVDYKPELIVDFPARQKLLDWQKKNLRENGGHHVCPKDGSCPVHGKIQHKPDLFHHGKGKSDNGSDSAVKPASEEPKPSAGEPTPDKNK